MLGGLVAVSAGAIALGNTGAVAVGVIAGLLVPTAAAAIDGRAKLDDPLGVIAIHGVGGLWASSPSRSSPPGEPAAPTSDPRWPTASGSWPCSWPGRPPSSSSRPWSPASPTSSSGRSSACGSRRPTKPSASTGRIRRRRLPRVRPGGAGMSRRFKRHLSATLVAAAAGCARLPAGDVGAIHHALSPAGQVVVLRGFQDWYSTGMDRLTGDLRSAGLNATAFREDQWGDVADGLESAPAGTPLVLIGFSYGADDAVSIARRLRARGRPVDLLVTIDPVTPGGVPPNVRRCVNFYEPNGVWDLFRGCGAFRCPPTIPSRFRKTSTSRLGPISSCRARATRRSRRTRTFTVRSSISPGRLAVLTPGCRPRRIRGPRRPWRRPDEPARLAWAAVGPRSSRDGEDRRRQRDPLEGVVREQGAQHPEGHRHRRQEHQRREDRHDPDRVALPEVFVYLLAHDEFLPLDTTRRRHRPAGPVEQQLHPDPDYSGIRERSAIESAPARR